MATHYYVYYRIDPGQAEGAAGAVQRAQDALWRRTGVRGRRMRRADDATTWMEVYEAVADRKAFDSGLEAIVREHGLERWLAPNARRHLECFED